MKKLIFFIWHIVIFIAGSISIAVYVFIRLTSPASKAGLGGLIVMPRRSPLFMWLFSEFYV